MGVYGGPAIRRCDDGFGAFQQHDRITGACGSAHRGNAIRPRRAVHAGKLAFMRGQHQRRAGGGKLGGDALAAELEAKRAGIDDRRG